MPRKRDREDSALLVALGDTHCGSLVGLMSPEGIDRDDGQHVSPSAFQRLLWAHYQKVLARIDELKPGRQVFLILMGDLTDGDPHGSLQNITANRVTQRQIADDALAPLIERTHHTFVLRGTPAHVGQQAQDEETLARAWHGRGLPVEREGAFGYSWPELWLPVGGILVHARHHGRGGAGARNPNAAAVKLAEDTIMMCVNRGWQIPRLALRGHRHVYGDSHETFAKCRAMFLPSWQGMTEYGYRLDAPAADNGAALFCIKQGEIEYAEVIRQQPPAPKPWRGAK